MLTGVQRKRERRRQSSQFRKQTVIPDSREEGDGKASGLEAEELGKDKE